MSIVRIKDFFSYEHHYSPDKKKGINLQPLLYLESKKIVEIPATSKQKVFFCLYFINKAPFLEYLLYKDTDDLCYFPFVTRTTTIKKHITNFLEKTIKLEDGEWIHKGNIIHDNNVYIFIKIRKRKTLETTFKYRKSRWWWTIIDEICNLKKVMNFPIHYSVTNLFLQNPHLIYLYSKDGEKIEAPRALYYGTEKNIAPFYFIFGPKQTVKGRYGPYYYLGTYNKAIRYTMWDTNYKRLNNGVLLRFAVFLGNLKVLLNHPDDNKEKATPEINKELGFILKMEDKQGLWAKNYSSLYNGRAKIQLTHGTERWRLNPGFITKGFKQQVPLTMHIIDQTTAKKNWDATYEKYYIK